MSFFNPSKSVKKWTLGAIAGSGNLTDQSIQNFEPIRRGGETTYSTQLGALGLGGQAGYDQARSAFRTSPGYDVRMGGGTQAIDRSAASRGSIYSGATLKALTRYGQGLADQEWDQWQDRLGQLSALGMQAAAQQAGLREAQANRLYQGYTGIGNAQANQNLGYMNMAVNGITSLGKMFMGGGGFGNLGSMAGGGSYSPYMSGSGGLW